ncbi:hypothetical protein EG68_04182 [Paragonimus skrjabini miyazakii]|uniref:Uncharacterized protein n=1 Tax=Paragonimus skrjabini miyazakii TaxID=59628 RepID=A0A8S9Z070_9TREM|nr:hypothetical protein EG68_04182 [Paragonimus skrjabini miyazakii]
MVSLMLFEERTDDMSAEMKTTSGECMDPVCPVQQTVPNSETISDSFSDRTGDKRTTIASGRITEQSRMTVSKSFLISSLLNALDVPEQDNTYKQNQFLKAEVTPESFYQEGSTRNLTSIIRDGMQISN